MYEEPPKEELARIKSFAHKCFGHLLDEGQIISIWRLAHGKSVIVENWPVPFLMRRIAKCHLCCWRDSR